jgi:hypothetical protein
LGASGGNFGGLAGYVNGTTVENVYATGDVKANVEDTTLSGQAGGLIGRVDANSTVTHAHVSGSSISGFDTVGGLAGLVVDAGSSITHAFATDVDVVGSLYAGGAVGVNNGYISNVYVMAPARDGVGGIAARYAGGIAGYNYGTLTNVLFDGNVNGNTSNATDITIAGGIAGQNFGQIDHAETRGTVGTTGGIGIVGGIAGVNSFTVSGGGEILNSISDTEFTGTAMYVGAITGVQRPYNVAGVGIVTPVISGNFFNADKNPGVDQVSTDSPFVGDIVGGAEVIGGGGLTTDQLADDNVRNTILDGGDVAGALGDFNTAQQPPPAPVAPPVDNAPPVGDGGGNVDAPTPPSNPTQPSDPVAPVTPPTDNPIADAPPPVTPPTNTGDVAPPPSAIPNITEMETMRTAAAQAMEGNKQLLGDVVSRAFGEKTTGFESTRIPLDQLMAHLTKAPASDKSSSATTEEKENYNSSVEDISVEGE